MKALLVLSTLSFLGIAQASNLNQFFSSSSTTKSSGRAYFNRNATWVVPAGVTTINVRVVAGGGGGRPTSGAGGGGGGGSCIKDGSTTLTFANGGRGSHSGESFGQPGGVTHASLTVTPGASLSVYVGGGGGGGSEWGSLYTGGGGGYGFCGSGGAGGNYNAVLGGAGGLDKGGGGGAAGTYAGGASTNSTGGNGLGAYTGPGGTDTVPGNATATGGGGGGASGGAGGSGAQGTFSVYAQSGLYAMNAVQFQGTQSDGGVICAISFSLQPGDAGNSYRCLNHLFGGGGAGGSVEITW